jgi:flagellar hook-associated protein FlgK
MVEFQRAYQAIARVVSVLNDLTETTVNLLR